MRKINVKVHGSLKELCISESEDDDDEDRSGKKYRGPFAPCHMTKHSGAVLLIDDFSYSGYKMHVTNVSMN